MKISLPFMQLCLYTSTLTPIPPKSVHAIHMASSLTDNTAMPIIQICTHGNMAESELICIGTSNQKPQATRNKQLEIPTSN